MPNLMKLVEELRKMNVHASTVPKIKKKAPAVSAANAKS